MKMVISRAQQGDRAALQELVNALWPRLVSMSRYYARRCAEDWEDLLGEAWCAVLTAVGETNVEIGQPEHFLLERARWRMLDYIKWARRRRDSAQDEEHDPATQGDVATHALDHVLIAQLAATLSETQRQVLTGLLSGHTWREVAATIGSSSANVAYHVRQIRKRCQHIVEAPVLQSGTEG